MKKKGKKVLKGNKTGKSAPKRAANPNHKEDFERVLKAFVTPSEHQTK